MMEAGDIVTDSYSMELVLVLVLERIWGRIQNYLASRDKKRDEERQQKQDAKQNETLAQIKATQEVFKEYIGNKLK